MERKKQFQPSLRATLAISIMFVMSQQLHLARADSTERDPNSVNYYSCNPSGGTPGGSTSDGKTYATYDEVFVCLFFEDGTASADGDDASPPEKMVFKA